MRKISAALAFSLLAVSTAARADGKKPADAPAATGKPAAATVDKAPDKKPDGKKDGKPADELDSIMEKATETDPPPDAKPETKPEAKTDAKPETKPAAKPDAKPDKVVANKDAGKAKPSQPPPPPTDDNDATTEAARPTVLAAIAPASAPRRPGPYELGALDCRVLDGAGIERLLPKKMTTGEEPDLLCRILITQPATVSLAPHELTLTVTVGNRATYQQVRPVRMSSVGRRAL